MILLLHEVCSDNYIVMYFLKTRILYLGFANAKRKSGDIEYLQFKSGATRAAEAQWAFNTTSNYYPLKVYFNKTITSLESYFDIAYDGNVKYIISLDFSNFDSSEITSSESLCKGCENLQYVNFTNFNTPKLSTMSNMFYGCSKLISIDLSNFVTSNVNNYTNLFSGCISLRLIDISGFNFGADSNINIFNGMFDGLDSLRYINLKNIAINTPFTSYINQCSLESKELLIVCEDSEILTSSNNKVLLCCDFNIESNTCNPTNYTITILYWYEQVSYNEGFITSDYRKDVFFINYNGRTYGGNNQLIIESTPSPLQICFSKPIVNLAHFFDSESNLAKADFSGLNSPDIVEMSYLFYNCQNLFEVNFNNFNMKSVVSADNMFNGTDKLRYISIYDVTKTNNYITESYLKKINKLTVCQNDNIITNEDAINDCCYFDVTTDKCISSNYIEISFGEKVEYENGFGRKGIDFLIYGSYIKISSSDKFVLLPNNRLKIFISTSITSLESFFSIDQDVNADKIISVDFNHFDMSKITNLNSLLKGCTLLKKIDLSNFKTSLVTDMGNLFSGCESLEIIDLTYFNTTLVTNMDEMFYNCKSLKILEIRNFNMSKVESANYTFTYVNQLKYINIYNIIDSNNLIANSGLNSLSKQLTVCQRNIIIEGGSNECCYFDLSSEKCINNNYITIYYGDNVIYDFGFKNEKREGISFIKNSLDHENIIEPNARLNIKKGTKIEVYFLSKEKSLAYFFSTNDDENTKNITYIDLSNFDTSLVTYMNFMFYGCSSLTSIDLTNFNTSLVTYMHYMFYDCSSLTSIDLTYFETQLVIDMKYMFYNCKSLKSIDLSYFNTTSLTDINHLFSKCDSLEIIDLSYFNTTLVQNMDSLFLKCSHLKVIDISTFDMKKVQTASDMFKYVTNLKYINLFYITESYEFITNSDLKKITNLIVCQKEKIVQNKDAINKCCYYDIENEKCGSTNFIFIYYGNDVRYIDGFQVNNNYDFRHGIEHLILIDYKKKLNSNEQLNIHAGAKLEIYFNSNEIDLNEFFNSNKDSNTNYITSIDFSNFYSSSINNLSYTFYGCNSLKILDLSNLNTSSVTDMSYMFCNCTNIISLDLSNFDTTLVVSMEKMFMNCYELTSVDLSSFNTPFLQNMESMFESCLKLVSLDLSSFNTTLVTNIYQMLYSCNALQYLDISHFNFKNVLTYDDAFLTLTSELKYFNIYHVKNSDSIITDSYLNGINNLIVCQKENIITNEYVKNECCFFNFETNECENNNYITIRYGDNTEYNFGFIKDKNNNTYEFRKNIEFITNTNIYNKLNNTDKLILKRGSKLDIYFSSPLSSLENFFDAEIDINMKNAILIDLSHFDMTLMTNMNYLFSNCISLKNIYLPEEIKLKDQMIQIFYECNSLESIDLSCFDTSSVTDMNKLFYNCNSIINLDLSTFNTKSTINMNEIFYGCTSLEVLDISSFNMKNLKENSNMFEGLNNLLYLNIYDVKNSYLNITNSLLNKKNDLTVCQKEKLITNENIISKCCFIDRETSKCDAYNFIILYYKEDCTYESGFNKNNKRNGIKYIINGNKKNKIYSDEKLVIKSGTKIEIYYDLPLNTLESYFSINYDSNADKIEQIDLLNFDSSSVTDMSSMFFGCSSLKLVELSNFDTSSSIKMNFMFFGCSSLQIIDLSNFKTSLVKNMNYMFYGCYSLKSLILPQLDTSSVINMNSMFSGCSSLKSLDLSSFKTSLVINMNYMFYDLSSLESLNITNFNLKNIKNADYMFTGLNKLKYIDLYNVRNENKFISESDLNKNNKLSVCQKDIIIKDKTIKCEGEHNNIDDDTNYIIVEYGKQTNYPNGFINNDSGNNDYRKDIGIKYIIIENDQYKYDADKELNIEAGTRIQIHFSNLVTSFQSFFDSTYDKNAENIEFIDFSNFNSSSVTNMNSLFKGCTSLKVVDMSNLDLKSIEQSSSLFTDANNLKYIILNNIQNYNEKKLNLEQELNNSQILIVCQNDEIIKNINYKYKCCDFNIKNGECEYENSISIKFSKETEYPNGFSYHTIDANINEYRNNSNFIIYLNDEKYGVNEGLSIPENSKLILKFESNVTSLKNFFRHDDDENVENIVSVDISHLDLSSVTDMSNMFLGCSSLENVYFPNMNAPLLTDISYIFSGCQRLKSFDFTNFNTPLLITMRSMFSDCSNLKSIDISNINIPLVTDMSHLFYACSLLTFIDASDLVTSSVTDMSFMFAGCVSLKYLDISNFNFENIQSAENMFNGDDNLAYINIYNIKSSYPEIINNLLKDYNKLTVCQKDDIISGNNIINKCCYFNLESGECDELVDSESGDRTLYTNYIIVKFGRDVEYNSGFAIDTYSGYINEYRRDIKFIIYKNYTNKINTSDKLIISANTKIEIYLSSRIEDIQSFFSSNYDYNVESIISIDLSHLETSLIENMNSLFLGCYSLESIDLNNKDLLNIKNMNLMFLGCNSLQSIILPNETISNIEEMNSIFLECSSLKSIDLSNLVTTSLTNMGKMFYRCQSLSSIDLSVFDTSLVIDMNEMFYKCDSLLYLDISNFDMANTRSYGNMILANNNIKFINLYNFKNDKIIAKIFKKKKNFYVCQKELIITNPRAFNCCDYNFEIDECNYAIPTQITTDLQNIIDTTEGELIEISDEPTTQYTDKKPTTELPNTHKPIPPTIKPETNTHIEPTSEKEQTTILKTDTLIINTTAPIVPTTIHYEIATTIPKINPTIIIETTTFETEMKLVLLGFNGYIMKPSWFSFWIYFISLTNSVYPENLIVPLTIINNNSLRTLSDVEGKCTLQGSGTKVKGQYLCEVEADNSNINQIKIGNDFKFGSENNVTVVGITPIANMYMDNIQNIGNKFGDLENSTIYILDHSIYKKYGNYLFNITGTINDPQPNITDDDFALIMNRASNDKTPIEVNCNIADIIGNNYTLNCKSNENIKGDLQSAISFIDDDILIINFNEKIDREIELETNSESLSGSGRFSRKKNGGLNAGAIVAIILAFAAAIISVIAIMVYCKKENHNKHKTNESTIIKINGPKVDSTKILN